MTLAMIRVNVMEVVVVVTRVVLKVMVMFVV